MKVVDVREGYAIGRDRQTLFVEVCLLPDNIGCPLCGQKYEPTCKGQHMHAYMSGALLCKMPFDDAQKLMWDYKKGSDNPMVPLVR